MEKTVSREEKIQFIISEIKCLTNSIYPVNINLRNLAEEILDTLEEEIINDTLRRFDE